MSFLGLTNVAQRGIICMAQQPGKVWSMADDLDYEEDCPPVTPDEVFEAILSGWFSPMSNGDHDIFEGIKGEGYSGEINGYSVFLDHRENFGITVSIPVEDGTWIGNLAAPGTFEKDI